MFDIGAGARRHHTGSALIDADGDDTRERPSSGSYLRVRRHRSDSSGIAGQRRAPASTAVVLDAKTSVGVAPTMLLDPKVPFTAGTWRNIDLICAPGSIVSSLPPDGGIMMFWELGAGLGDLRRAQSGPGGARRRRTTGRPTPTTSGSTTVHGPARPTWRRTRPARRRRATATATRSCSTLNTRSATETIDTYRWCCCA